MRNKQPQTTYASVLFDLDGTLADTSDDFVHVLNYQRSLYHLAPLPPLLIRNTVSDGARALTSLAFGGAPGETKFESRREELLAIYLQEVGRCSTLFSGMNEALDAIEDRNMRWGVVTNKPRKYAEILMQKLGLEARCSVLVCPDDVANAKPSPEGLLLASRTIKVAPRECLYAGDHIRDIEAGRAANMPTIAARYGYIHPDDDLTAWKADHIIDHPLELLTLFD